MSVVPDVSRCTPARIEDHLWGTKAELATVLTDHRSAKLKRSSFKLPAVSQAGLRHTTSEIYHKVI